MITEFLNAGFSVLSPEIFFACGVSAVCAAFTVCLFISIFKSGYGLKKRLWYLIIVAAVCALTKARANFSGEDFTPILLFLGLILFIPLYFIRVKVKADIVEDASRRDFVHFLDEKIKHGSGVNEFSLSPVRERGETLKAEPKTQSVAPSIDFSHVKNVLQRLEPASLSYAERRQIHDLELLLYEAESGENTPELKSKINEGLGNLLKIMAKHGV